MLCFHVHAQESRCCFTSLEKCLSLFIWQHKHKTISDSLTAQQLISNTPKTKNIFAAMFDFAQVNLARPFCSFLSNPSCDGDFFSSTLFFSSPLSSYLLFLFSPLHWFHVLLCRPFPSLALLSPLAAMLCPCRFR